MPWIEASLRGQRVLARVRDDGTLASEGGRVEIRYKPTDGRAYRAAARNLVVAAGSSSSSSARILPDDACAPAAPAETPAPKARDRPVPADAWQAFTDGACSGNPGPAGAGVVLVSPDGKMHEGYEWLGHDQTNNIAELTAILRALEWIPSDARAIVVHTDSQYSIGVLQKNWKAKANKELVERTKVVLRQRAAHLRYVPGHQGVALNEKADELARRAIAERTSKAPL